MKEQTWYIWGDLSSVTVAAGENVGSKAGRETEEASRDHTGKALCTTMSSGLGPEVV